MKKVFFTTVMAISAFVFLSCEKKSIDAERPVIKLIAPEEEEGIKPGADIHFDLELTDNVALGSYKVNIHPNFDGHHHAVARGANVNDGGFNKTWEEKEFIAKGEEPVKGKKSAKIHHHHIVIPREINGKPIKEGEYHFMVHCTDMAGNDNYVARNIIISSGAEEHEHH